MKLKFYLPCVIEEAEKNREVVAFAFKTAVLCILRPIASILSTEVTANYTLSVLGLVLGGYLYSRYSMVLLVQL